MLCPFLTFPGEGRSQHYITVNHAVYFLPPANKVWGKAIFSGVCVKNSVHMKGMHARGYACPGGMHGWGVMCMPGGHAWLGDMHGRRDLHGWGACMARGWDTLPPPGPETGTTRSRPPGLGTPKSRPPRTRHFPAPPRTRHLPWDQSSPSGPGTPLAADPPWEQTPPRKQTSSAQYMLGDMGYKWAVRILLECNLVRDIFVDA